MKFFLLVVFFISTLFAKNEVLLIHSYYESYPWTKSQRIGFKVLIDSSSTIFPFYSSEYLDTKRRNFDGVYEKEVFHYFSSKYIDYRPNVIYVTDDDALNFVIKHKERLFPSVPVVFSGINDFSKKGTLDSSMYSGIFEKKEIIPNLKLIKTLFPDEKEVLVVSDGSSTAQLTRREIEKQVLAYGNMAIRYVSDKSFDVVLNQLKSYKGKAIILTTIGGFHSSNGDLIPIKEATRGIVGAGPFVVLALEDSYIQEGVLGGYCVDGNAQGSEAGKLALHILLHPKSPLIHVDKNTNNWIFDAQVLENSEIILPRDIRSKSVFFNPPETFLQLHEELLMNLLYGLGAALFVMMLFFNRHLYRSRRVIKQRESTLSKISKSLNKAQSIAHLGNWEWDVQTNEIWWSDEIYRIFGVIPQAFKPTYDGFFQRVHPDDREMVKNALEDALANNSAYHVVHRILRLDGAVRYVLEEGEMQSDENGQHIQMSGIVYDITEEKNGQIVLEASENKYRNLVENAMIGIYRTDLLGKILYVNQTLTEILGFDSPNDLIGQDSTRMYLNPKIQKKIITILFKKHHVSNYELEVFDKNHLRVPIMLSATLEGEVISGVVLDMRELKRSRQEIDKLSKAVSQIDDIVVITDKEGIITYVNQAFSRHTGYAKSEAVGKTSSILKSGNHDNAFYEHLWNTILNGEMFRGTLINRKKNGDLYYEDKTITPLLDENEEIIGFITTGRDVTHETLLNQEIQRIATIDNLTGIFNRHKFEELFSLESERARRFSLPLSLMLIDIDHFKLVNDTYGHETGDEVLKKLANVVQDTIRKLDIFARWGGEEFLVLCPNTDLESIHVLAEKLRLVIEDADFPGPKKVTVSIGISAFDEHDSFSDLFKRVDKGLYYAKEHGRNQVSSIEH